MFGINTNSKDYYDLFDDSDIEEKTNFDLTIKGEKNNNY